MCVWLWLVVSRRMAKAARIPDGVVVVGGGREGGWGVPITFEFSFRISDDI